MSSEAFLSGKQTALDDLPPNPPEHDSALKKSYLYGYDVGLDIKNRAFGADMDDDQLVLYDAFDEFVQMAAKGENPKLGGNVTPELLSDQLGLVRQLKKHIEKYEGFYKEALKARLNPGQVFVEGDRWFNTHLESGEQNRLDTEMIRNDMDQEWLDEHTKTIQMTTVRSVKKKNDS